MKEQEPCEIPTVGSPAVETKEHLLYDLSPQQYSVLKCLIDEDMILRPYEIGQITGIDPKSVSARLSELKEMNKVIYKDGGYWTYNPLHNPTKDHIRGDLQWGWRVQNVRLYADVVVGVGERLCFDFGGIGVTVWFGETRDKVTVAVQSAKGLDYSHWLLVLDKVDALCCMRGYEGLCWFVSMCEVLRDYDRMQLEGISGYTLTRFKESVIEKIYEKPGDVVRHERRIHPEKIDLKMPRDVLSTFLANGVQGMDFAGEIQSLRDAIDALTVAMKYHNGGQYFRADEVLAEVSQ